MTFLSFKSRLFEGFLIEYSLIMSTLAKGKIRFPANKLFKFIFSCLLIPLLFKLSLAQEPSFSPFELIQSSEKQEGSSEELKSDSEVLIDKKVLRKENEAELVSLWRGIIHSLDDRRINDALSKIDDLNDLKMKLGRDSLRVQSKHLISVAGELKDQGIEKESALLAEAAVKISPLSLGIYIDASNFTNNVNLIEILINAKEMLGYDPAGVLSLLVSGIYPFLWANVFGILLFFLLYFTSFPRSVLDYFNGVLPGAKSDIKAFIVGIICFIAPLYFGPIWTVAVWSLLYLLISSNRKWAVFISGAVIILWGALIPLRENLNIWLNDAGMKSAVEVLSGSTSENDFRNMQKLLNERPTDGVLYYALGQYFRRSGEFEDAAKAFNRSEIILGNQPYTRAQRGLIELVKGEYVAAEKFFSEAEAMGLKSAAFYYNMSKAKIMQLSTTGSAEYYSKAKEANPLVTKVLDRREEVSGVSENEALGEINLPFPIILRSALTPFSRLSFINESIASLIMPGVSLGIMLSFGLFLLVSSLAFLSPGKKRSSLKSEEVSTLRKLVSYLPGGSDLLSGFTGKTFITFSILFLALFPFFSWPLETLVLFGGSKPKLFSFYALIVLGMLILGSLSSSKRRDI